MEHFLKLVAEDLFRNCSDPQNGLSHITVVFPNRRARLFFDEYLSMCNDKPLWSPSYTTIADLFQSQTKLETADRYKLISLLYHIYSEELHSKETPDSFWNWGELMLSDFDDIDRNMADADGLFACLQNHKEIEGKAFLSEHQAEVLKSFFSGFDADKTELQEKYAGIWSALGPIYHKFHQQLESQGIAYDGMLQRTVASSIDSCDFGDRTYAFVGFNSLDKAEKILFRYLQQSGKALFYWDYDKSYVEDESNEAGLFLRNNLIEFPNRLSGSYFDNLKNDKRLTIVETSSDNAQARFIPQWLDSLKKVSGSKPDEKPDKDTAIVLCDSGLLQPVLHSIPGEKVGNVNVTMGFPLGSISLSGFISAILDAQRITLKNGGRLTISHVGRILNNPLTSMISADAQRIYRELKESRQFYPNVDDLQKDEALKAIFALSTDNLTLLDNLLTVLRILAPALAKANVDTIFQPMYNEALYRCYTQVSRFRTLIEEGSFDTTTEMLCKLLRKVIGGTTVPFHGEPVMGMQVMGMIETRNLDFRNILLLSAAEGTLPSGSSEASFIPYSIRMAFGLSSMKEKSAVASYNFHHLLQRAENVTMVYNGNADAPGIGKGQISRYLLQLIVSGRKVQRIVLQPAHSERKTEGGISVKKDADVIGRLCGMYDTGNTKNYISPSALNCYIDCKLKYYLQYVAGIRARKENPEEIDASLFGTLFHLSAELTYNALDENVTVEKLDAMLKDRQRTTSFVREAFRRELFDGKDIDPKDYNGTQSVNFEVIHRYLRQMLRMDKVYAPFRYLGSEANEYSHLIAIPHPDGSGREMQIRLSGRIDRMDCKDGIYRIADYKTGHIEDNPKTMDDLFSAGKKRRKYALQTFYYATLVHHSESFRDRKLAPVLLYLRHSAKPTEDDIYMKMNGVPVCNFAADYMEEYQQRLQDVIKEIFDSNVQFTQTDDNDICQNCDFRDLCRK